MVIEGFDKSKYYDLKPLDFSHLDIDIWSTHNFIEEANEWRLQPDGLEFKYYARGSVGSDSCKNFGDEFLYSFEWSLEGDISWIFEKFSKNN